MIINCPCGEKKFEVDESLIPHNGRLLKCGSCDQTWFFKKSEKKQEIYLEQKKEIKFSQNFKDVEKKINISKIPNISKNSNLKNKDYQLTKYKSKSKFSIERFFSYILVFIISFIGMIIILDTFKNLLYENFPLIETIMFNLFEIIKDISLFIKDLF